MRASARATDRCARRTAARVEVDAVAGRGFGELLDRELTLARDHDLLLVLEAHLVEQDANLRRRVGDGCLGLGARLGLGRSTEAAGRHHHRRAGGGGRAGGLARDGGGTGGHRGGRGADRGRHRGVGRGVGVRRLGGRGDGHEQQQPAEDGAPAGAAWGARGAHHASLLRPERPELEGSACGGGIRDLSRSGRRARRGRPRRRPGAGCRRPAGGSGR